MPDREPERSMFQKVEGVYVAPTGGIYQSARMTRFVCDRHHARESPDDSDATRLLPGGKCYHWWCLRHGTIAIVRTEELR